MANVFDKAAELGIVPVLSIPDVSHAVPLVKGLAKGGLPLIEVMFRTDAALDSIREIAEKCPDWKSHLLFFVHVKNRLILFMQI